MLLTETISLGGQKNCEISGPGDKIVHDILIAITIMFTYIFVTCDKFIIMYTCMCYVGAAKLWSSVVACKSITVTLVYLVLIQ